MTQVQTPTTTATRPVANPAPLGLLGFGITTLVLNIVNANIFGNQLGLTTVLPLALAFGGGAQLLAGMWEFFAGNTFGATAFTSYGAFWISFYFLATQGFLDPKSANYAGPYALAVYLLGWTVFTGIVALAALRVNGVTASLIILLFLTFLGLTISNFITAGGGDGSSVLHVTGFVGIVTAINAFYNALAGMLKDLAGRDVLPVFPVKR